VQRLMVVWCPGLEQEEEHGRQARALARVVSALEAFTPRVEVIRPGVCAMATRGPSRYFGGDEALAGHVARAVAGIDGVQGAEGCGTGIDAGVGVADGLSAALLAARAAGDDPVVVAPGTTPSFLAPWPIAAIERPDLADLLARLGIRTLGRFAQVPEAHVLARFGTEGVACHRVARGIEGELPGQRVSSMHGPGEAASGPALVHQPGFFGGAAGAEARAATAVQRVQELLGPEAAVVARLQGGRGPGERARLVPFGARRTETGGTRDDPPWPGQVPTPAPVLVYSPTLPALVVDADGRPVGVTADGMVSAAPARLSITGERWVGVAGWAGPWPADERWWSTRRRRARMQVVTVDGTAHLLIRERGGWWLQGTYD